MKSALLLTIAVAAGCAGATDPCAGVSGTCVALTVTSSTVEQADTLLIGAFGESQSSADGKLRARALPIHVALVPPASLTGDHVITVTAFVQGNAVGQGSGTATVTPGKHTALKITLASGDATDDLAAPEPDDLSGPSSQGDGGDADLSLLPSCPVNEARCTGTSGTAVCIDIASDPQNCGSCGNACSLGQSCHNAGCIENSVNCSSAGVTCQLSTCSSGQLSISSSGDVVVDVTHGRRLWSRAHQPAALKDVAGNFCSKLSLDGVTSGWRLPTLTEAAQTLLNPGGLQGCGQCDPAIDQAAFPDVPADELEWTTTPGPGGVFNLVDYCSGRSTSYGNPSNSESYSYRCTHDPL